MKQPGATRNSRYDAFISYRHVEPDRHWARWLHTSLESYRVPSAIVRDLGVERRIGRVFRDEEELQASADLSMEIEEALGASRYLIVVCSPSTPASKWVEQEISRFRELGRGDRILALLIRGEPHEAFPRPLWEIRRDIADASGRVIGEQVEEAEPLAADVRPHHHLGRSAVRRNALLRIVSLLLDCRFDDLRRRHVQRRRKRVLLAGVVTAAVVLGFLAVAGFGIHQALKRAESDAYAALAQERERQRLERASREIEPSLALVGTGRRSGGFIQNSASAWVAAHGVLATSAHVVETHETTGGDSVFVARSTTPPHRNFVIERVTVHPGLAVFRELQAELQPVDPQTGRPESLSDACDVALLHLAPDRAGGLGPPLRIADPGVLGDAEPGSEVACLGFASEGLIGRTAMGALPNPMVQRGVYTGMVDVLNEPSPLEDALRVTFDLIVTGGASGSPVFNGRGEVLAVLSSASFVVVQGRRVQIGSAAHGDRADLVRELLDGRAEALMPARRNAWRGALRARVDLMARAFADVVLLTVNNAAARHDAYANIQGWELVHEARVELTGQGLEAGAEQILHIPRIGHVVVVAVADRAVDIDIATRFRGERAYTGAKDETDSRQAAWKFLKSEGGKELEMRILSRAELSTPLGCSLRVFLSTE